MQRRYSIMFELHQSQCKVKGLQRSVNIAPQEHCKQYDKGVFELMSPPRRTSVHLKRLIGFDSQHKPRHPSTITVSARSKCPWRECWDRHSLLSDSKARSNVRARIRSKHPLPLVEKKWRDWFLPFFPRCPFWKRCS